jgi:hypothetical protein
MVNRTCPDHLSKLTGISRCVFFQETVTSANFGVCSTQDVMIQAPGQGTSFEATGSSPGGPTTSPYFSYPYGFGTKGLSFSHSPLVLSAPHWIHGVMGLGPGDVGAVGLLWGQETAFD